MKTLITLEIEHNKPIPDLAKRLKLPAYIIDGVSDVNAVEPAARVAALERSLQDLLDNVDEPPEANCSCHISPPCGDCVNYSGAREAFASARAALKGRP
jgi:hypothetical protein